MQVQINTDDLKPCLCGFKPTYFGIAYGPTPYSVWCPQCQKGTNDSRYAVTGSSDGIISLWNELVSTTTIEVLMEDYRNSRAERIEAERLECAKAIEYQWYWCYDGTTQLVQIW